MNFPYALLPDSVHLVADLLYVVLLAVAVRRIPWKKLQGERQRINVLLGSSVGLLLLWQLKAGIIPGLSYHLLGGALFVLMFGWELALVGVSMVLMGTTINSGIEWMALGINGLVMVAVPVLISQSVLWLAQRFLPHHFFIYVIGNGFLCGGLTMVATVGIATLLFMGFSPYTLEELTSKYLIFAPLMTFAEAFFTGMLSASLVLMRPEWIATFDDRRYLSGK